MTEQSHAKALRDLLAKEDLTATEAARLIGVSQSSLSRMCNGRVDNPSSQLVGKLARLFRVSPDVILGKEPIPSGSGLVITDYRVVPVVPLSRVIEGGPMSDKATSWLPCPQPCHQDSFAVLIDNGACSPVVNPGDHVVFDPAAERKQGSIILAEIDGEPVVRRLEIEGTAYYAAAAADWPAPTQKITHKQVIGVAIFKGRAL
jgi:SOS-response transcriptional repressor LexA